MYQRFVCCANIKTRYRPPNSPPLPLQESLTHCLLPPHLSLLLLSLSQHQLRAASAKQKLVRERRSLARSQSPRELEANEKISMHTTVNKQTVTVLSFLHKSVMRPCASRVYFSVHLPVMYKSGRSRVSFSVDCVVCLYLDLCHSLPHFFGLGFRTMLSNKHSDACLCLRLSR